MDFKRGARGAASHGTLKIEIKGNSIKSDGRKSTQKDIETLIGRVMQKVGLNIQSATWSITLGIEQRKKVLLSV